MKKGKLIGIITDRDLKRASASAATTLEIHELLYLLTRIKVKHIMTREVITVPPDFTMAYLSVESLMVIQAYRVKQAERCVCGRNDKCRSG